MDVKAKVKYLRISPRKARLVIDVVRGLDLADALSKLAVINKKSSKPITKLINSATSNAVHNNEAKEDNLYIKEIRVDEGPTLYRWMPRAFGRATQLRKKTSHVTVVLSEKVESKETKATTKKTEEIETVKLESKKELLENEEGEEAKTDEEKNKAGVRPSEKIKTKGKKSKGVLNKMFRRKSGM